MILPWLFFCFQKVESISLYHAVIEELKETIRKLTNYTQLYNDSATADALQYLVRTKLIQLVQHEMDIKQVYIVKLYLYLYIQILTFLLRWGGGSRRRSHGRLTKCFTGRLGRLQPPHFLVKRTICLDFLAKFNLFQPAVSPLLRSFHQLCFKNDFTFILKRQALLSK